MKKTITIATLAAAGLVAAALAGVGLPEQARGEAGSARTITVTGEGVVEARPDRAEFSFGVEERADTAGAALAANARATRALIAALEQAGVAKDDVQTESVSVWPNVKEGGGVTGYTASNSVRVSSAVAKAGSVVDAATAAGADTVWGPTLTRDENDALEERALRLALADARRKAGALAGATDGRLGEVVKIVEGGAEPEPIYARALAAEANSSTPIEPGTLETRASLTVTFAVAQ